MASDARTLLLKSVTEAEYSRIEEPVRNKIEGVFNEHINDYLTAKTYFETSRASQEVKIKDIEEHLRTALQEKDEIKIKFDLLQSQFEETSKSVTTVRNELNSVRDEIQRLEKETDNLRRERNEAVDEKQTTANLLARCQTEIDVLKSDIGARNAELKASLEAKCEALALAEDTQSKQADLRHKEKLLESERALISKQIVDLNAELFQANNAMTKQRREATNQAIMLQTTISEKEEELRMLKEQTGKLQDQNNELSEKLATLTERLKEQKAEEEKMQEALQQQLNAQISLADSYKERLAESEAHSAELGGAVRELQRLLQEATSQYGELETRLNQNEQDAANTLQANQESIKALKEELKHANLLLEAVKQESSEAAVSRLSPMAASASKLLKSGLTLTQLYTKFAEVTRELMVEKNEKETFKKEVETLRKEIEEKVPLIQKQKQEYEYTLNSLETLKAKVNQLEEENTKLKVKSSDAEAMVERLTQYNKRFNETIKDLSRQICYLLREVETAKGNGQPTIDIPPEVRRAEMKTSPEVISKNMVTFKGMDELKLLNLRLLVSLMEQLDSKRNGNEKSTMSGKIEELNDLAVIQKYLVKFENIEQLQLINLQMLASLKELNAEREREKFERESRNAEGVDTRDSHKVKELQDQVSRLDTKVEDLLDREKFLMKQIEVIKNQRDVYHKLFLSQSKGGTSVQVPKEGGIQNVESMDETSTKGENTGQNSEINKSNDTSEGTKSHRMVEDLRKEFEIYRQERTANEKLLVETVAKLRTDLGNAVKDRAELASRAEYNQATCDRLKSRLKAIDLERVSLEDRCSNYSTAISNLEGNLCRVSNEVMDLLNKLSIAEITVTNLKEENAFLKQSESRLLKNIEFHKKEKHGQELLMSSLEALKVKFECAETEAKLKLESKLKEVTNEYSCLKRQLQEEQDRKKGQMELLEKQTITAKQRLEEERLLRQKTNDQVFKYRNELKERDQKLETLTQQLKFSINQSQPVLDRENKIRELEMLIKQKDNTIKCLEEQMAVNKTCVSEVSEKLQCTEKQLAEVKQKFESYKQTSEKKVSDLQVVENDLRRNIRNLETKLKTINANEIEERAARDVELSSLKNRMESLGTVLNDAKERAVKAESEAKEAAAGTKVAEGRAHQLVLENNKLIQDTDDIRTALSAVKTELEATKLDNSQLKEKILDLTKVNDLLHDQIQELGAKAAEGANRSSNGNDDSQKEPEKLLEVLKIMKREKDAANDEIGNLRDAKIQLESELEILKNQLKEMELKIQEGETSRELQNKIKIEDKTLNELVENKILFGKKENLENELFTIEQRASNIDAEIIQTSKVKITELESTIERLSAENTALKEESQRWPYQGGNQEEVKRLIKEKENLSNQLSKEREQNQLAKSKFEEQLVQLRCDKEEAISSLSTTEKNLAALRQELRETKDSLKEVTHKLSNSEVEMIAKDASLSDIRNKEVQIRQIAKKYKAQFQELTKTLEDERKLRDVAGSSSSSVTEEKWKNLTEQVSTLQRENEALQRENDSLKAGTLEREDRAKTLLKNARNRILQLTDENKALKEFGDFRGTKVEGSSSSADSSTLEVRISRLEKEKEEDQLEKEKLLRELDLTTQRLLAVQRQLEKQQASKPSTSSGERSSTMERTSDPPTANIKPMGGPSTSTNKQAQTQHAVTVTPWRETPFASIKPMSQATRTVVVQPTSQTAASAPTCSQPPLAGRQQQVVHTSSTCEGLSSSPTSSHMDYIPSVSSAVHNILHPNVILGQHLEAETGGAENIGTVHCIQPAVSVALVLPQPASQTQGHLHTQSGEGSMENNGVVSASNQEHVSENSVTASNHGSGLPQADYYREDNGTDGVAASESSSTASGILDAGGSGGDGSNTATSQQAASSTTSVTTSVAHQAPLAKRPHHHHPDHVKHLPPIKRSRMAAVGDCGSGEMSLRSDGLEVEYQVPTSSQRDQEDDVLVTSGADQSPKALDGQDFEEEGEEESRYELDPYGRDAQELLYQHEEVPESDMHILDEASSVDEDNNEVEILDVSSEVPNQCESSAHVDASNGSASGSIAQTSEEARVSGTGSSNSERSGEAMATSLELVTSNQQYQSRRPTTMPALNRHHISLSYDDPGDDSIVPSTPTLFVPRRSDGFCETVSSPQVPTVRFTFSQDHPSNNTSSSQAGVAQVASEGMDDTRMDLSQLDEGTGRSVPTTPLHVSSQESTVGRESGRAEDLRTGGDTSSIDTDPLSSAAVTVPDTPVDDQKNEREKASSMADVSGIPGTSSSTNVAGGSRGNSLLEEGREAEASTATASAGSTNKMPQTAKNKGGNRKSPSSARRTTTLRVSGNRGNNNTRTRQQPPLIWPLLELQQAAVQQTVTMLPLRGLRNRLSRAVGSLGLDRGTYRPRTRRGARGGYHTGGNFQNQSRNESIQNPKNTRTRRKPK